jgi:hypothetical protein
MKRIVFRRQNHSRERGGKDRSRTVGSFASIDVEGNMNVYVKQDSSSSVRVVADEDLMQYIIIEADGNTLHIKPKNGANLRSSQGIKVYVSNLSYKNFEVSGASDIYSENKITSNEEIVIEVTGASSVEMELHSPSVDADLTGASSVTLRGETKKFTADASGASGIRCFQLMTEETDVEVSGASHAKVFASIKISSTASGASGVEYKGNPSLSGESISGASSVRKVD